VYHLVHVVSLIVSTSVVSCQIRLLSSAMLNSAYLLIILTYLLITVAVL